MMINRKIRNSLIVAASLLVLSGCFDKQVSPQDAPKVVLQHALDSLYGHNYDTYINAVYTEGRQNLLPRGVMRKMLQQHVEAMEVEKGIMSGCVVHKAEFHTDTLATVYYRITFTDGKFEDSSQKMVRVGGEWKIVIRN